MKRFATIIMCLALIKISFAQQLAFPTAEGAGKYTKGGRGTTTSLSTIYYVTNLNDDGLIGSLRYALAQTTPYRTIVFNVSGTIHLLSNLSVKANTTIAGQTAPGDGICLADRSITLSGNNIIVRYLRFRLGDKNQLKTTPSNCGVPVTPFTASCMPLNGSGGDDALSATGRKNIIIDHCTMSWSNDESCSVYEGDSTTMQWCIMSEPLNYSYHFETGDADFERHGYGGIWGGRSSTFHHNLLAHCQGRACRFDGSRNLDGGTVGAENCEFSNNVIYNWGAYNVNGGEGGNYNILNNYYKYGPSTQASAKTMVINPYITSPLPYGKYFVTGNYMDGSTSVTNNNWLGAKMNGGSLADTNQSKVTAAFPIPSINLQTATDAYNAVLNGAGASIPARDTLDIRIVKNVQNRTGKIIDVQGNYPHATAYATTVNAWPTLVQGTPPTDTDGDGMPNWWETREGLNSNTATDRNTITTDGYTVLEKYLYSIPAWNSHASFASFTGNKLSSSLARFNFTTAWVKDGFTYALFRSNDSLGVYTKINSFSSDMNIVSFTIDDGALPVATSFYKIGSYKVGVTPDTLYSGIVRIQGIVTPVKFTNYELRIINEKQILNTWTTASEINTAHFNVQRSIDGRSFETVGTIAAKGVGSYSFNDNKLPIVNEKLTLYYRLGVIDKDGSKTYSDVKQITINDKQETINVFPNPTQGVFTVKHLAANKNATIEIVDETGKVCYQKIVKQGSTETVISQHKLPKGNYIIMFKNDNIKTNCNIVVM